MKASKMFSFAEFAAIASKSEEDFADFGVVVSQGYDEGSTYTYKDNGASVLGVAHLDTVQRDSWSSIIKVKGERVLMCPRLDDRLGVYIITRLLPKLGITCDWLLTTGEETGCSSAELFKPDKAYNWAFSFDRAGIDVVLYQHDHKRLRRVLRKAGFTVNQGMFSDLSSLDIGCSGINFGCGYEDNHSLRAYAVLSDTFRMVNLFQKFWNKYASERLPYDENAPRKMSYGYGSYSGYPGYSHNYGYASAWRDAWDGRTNQSWTEEQDPVTGEVDEGFWYNGKYYTNGERAPFPDYDKNNGQNGDKTENERLTES